MVAKLEKVLLNDNSTMYGYKNDYIINKIKEKKAYYELEVLKKFDKYIPHGSVIYDLGANIGNHTVYFYKYTNPQKIYSFEPIKEIYDVLIRNIKENNIKNIETFNNAVGSREDNGLMEIDTSNLGASRIIKEGTGNVEIVSIDKMNLDGPGFIKIDVEEYELNVLIGMKNTLLKYKPVIWIEIFSNNFEKVDNYLRNFGYEIIERIENNCIYEVPRNEEERILMQKHFKNNIVNYYDETVSIIRSKYKSLGESLTETKNKLKISNKEKQEIFDELSAKNYILEMEKNIISNKALMYINFLENLMIENEELKNKRKYLIQRTEVLYNNNQKLVKELKNTKNRYKALCSSKLGKLTIFYWRLRRRSKLK